MPLHFILPKRLLFLQIVNLYHFGIWSIKPYIGVIFNNLTMSKEVLEISVLVDEKFDMSFNLADGVLGLILRIFGN